MEKSVKPQPQPNKEASDTKNMREWQYTGGYTVVRSGGVTGAISQQNNAHSPKTQLNQRKINVIIINMYNSPSKFNNLKLIGQIKYAHARTV